MRVILLIGLYGVLFCFQAAAAQAPARDWSPRGAEALLRSADDKDRAWGAWIAGRLPDKDAVPLLEALVKASVAGDRIPSASFSVALDALIELDARPDPVVLRQVFNRR